MKSSSVSLELVPIQSGTNSSARYSAMASETKDKLRSVELRPTWTRVALAYMLFARGNRHVSAEMLFEEARQRKVSVSLATVYNTLHEFTRVGFLRQIAVDSSSLDTNNTDHHHYYLEDRHELMDIPSTDVAVGRVPLPPEGYEIDRVDVVVRLRRKRREIFVKKFRTRNARLNEIGRFSLGWAMAQHPNDEHLSLSLPKHRSMPLGPSQASPKLIPKEWPPPGFGIA